MKPFSLHSGQDGLWLAMLLPSPQHYSFKEDLPKAQGFPEPVRQCQTSVLFHHFQQLSLAAELVFKKSVSHCQQRYFESRAFNFCAHNYGKHEKILRRTSSMGSATILLQTNLVFHSLKQFHKQHNWDLHVSVLNIVSLTYARESRTIFL